MELYHQILAAYMADSERFDAQIDAPAVVEQICYKALSDIRGILMDEGNSDADCFAKIERIVEMFEQIGSDAGTRHDFG